MMTPEVELEMLETAYTAIVTKGVQSYSIEGRSLSKLDIRWLTERMETLRAIVHRNQNGMFRGAQFRDPE